MGHSSQEQRYILKFSKLIKEQLTKLLKMKAAELRVKEKKILSQDSTLDRLASQYIRISEHRGGEND